jgi:hypothetical protein
MKRFVGVTALNAVLIAGGVCLMGCSAPTEVRLKQEVGGLAKIGGSLSSAEAGLAAGGFSCGRS